MRAPKTPAQGSGGRQLFGAGGPARPNGAAGRSLARAAGARPKPNSIMRSVAIGQIGLQKCNYCARFCHSWARARPRHGPTAALKARARHPSFGPINLRHWPTGARSEINRDNEFQVRPSAWLFDTSRRDSLRIERALPFQLVRGERVINGTGWPNWRPGQLEPPVPNGWRIHHWARARPPAPSLLGRGAGGPPPVRVCVPDAAAEPNN